MVFQSALSRPWFAELRAYGTRRSLLGAAIVCCAILINGETRSPLHAQHNVSPQDAFAQHAETFTASIRPLVSRLCLECHSTDVQEGSLDLERFASLAEVRKDPAAWQRVEQMLHRGEMPPPGGPQLSSDEQSTFQKWLEGYLHAEALANAGDPGPVVLRRLNNAEYTYTIRDLTGIPLDPAREFPADSAAGEGFMNTGNSLVMSPALLGKYLDAGKEIASHAVLLPDGMRFSTGVTQRDWTNEILAEIRGIYLRHTLDQSSASLLDHWSVADPKLATAADGRVELLRYFQALIRHRDKLRADVNAATDIAKHERLNAKYFAILARMLTDDERASPLLQELRERWHTASLDDAPRLASEVRAWQDVLWQFNSVGHFGSVRPWQAGVNPLVERQVVQLPLAPSSGDRVIALTASTAGDGASGDLVVWQNPRFEIPGQPPLPLRDLRAAAAVALRLQQEAPTSVAACLAVVRELQSNAGANVDDVARKHQANPALVRAWLSYLGISLASEPLRLQHLNLPLSNVGGFDFATGWGMEGQDALAVMANASDRQVHIPGEFNAHQIAVHPRPDRIVAAGWRSPAASQVRVRPSVRHVHPACGNGVAWMCVVRHAGSEQIIRSGVLGIGETASIDPFDLHVQAGDLISLAIGPRDGRYECDLTQIDLAIEAVDSDHTWSLSADCADTISSGNPHADRYGNADAWHFYTNPVVALPPAPAVPSGSLLDEWLSAADDRLADELAARVQQLLQQESTEQLSSADRELVRHLTTLDGPLLSGLTLSTLATQATAAELQAAEYGLPADVFDPQDPQDIRVAAPSVLAIRLPRGLLTRGTFIAEGSLAADAGPEASVQLQAGWPQPDPERLQPGAAIVVWPDSAAAHRQARAMDDFRQYFPAAFCYPQIVPVDEVITLVLFHREDEPLCRLMLSDAEQARLDRLWDELHYISRDALTAIGAFEQIMEYATQDGDPSVLAPLAAPLQARAVEFQARLQLTEPVHLNAVVQFAEQAYRRPLQAEEAERLRDLYGTLRAESLPHEEAIQLLIARVLASPAFLYRLEEPAPGDQPAPVSDWELATRLSYFLWSSQPDEELRAAAAAGTLHTESELRKQLARMVQDPRVRRLADDFGCQWLLIHGFDEFDEKSPESFPEFAELRGLMYEESILFLQDLIQRDASLLEVFDADHTFVNERLAQHYGIAGVTGEEFRRVAGLRELKRGGVLTQAAVLSRQAGASRTSPILRGNWISEVLLGERLPRPPKNVPVLPETAPEGQTERQLIEQHTTVPECAKCHRRIDPYGFALENFDAIGRFREQDSQQRKIDAQATLPDGTVVAGLPGLQRYLSETRREQVVRQFCRKLLGYALGRSVQLSDEPVLDDMQTALREQDYRIGVALEKVVLSKQFREIRGRDQGTAGETEDQHAR